MLHFLIANGPSFNLLEKRNPQLYGGLSLEALSAYTEAKLRDYSVTLDWFQSNHEGDIVEKIHEAIGKEMDGIVINPGGYAHTSVAIHDALEIFSGPVIEVHLSHTIGRESFRNKKITAQAVDSILEGHGKKSYFLAVLSLMMGAGEG